MLLQSLLSQPVFQELLDLSVDLPPVADQSDGNSEAKQNGIVTGCNGSGNPLTIVNHSAEATSSVERPRHLKIQQEEVLSVCGLSASWAAVSVDPAYCIVCVVCERVYVQ